MKNLIAYSLILATCSCSGGGSSSRPDTSESLVNDSFVLEASASESLELFKEGGDAWRDPSTTYSLIITESSTWDRAINAGGERFYGEGDELNLRYEPSWNAKGRWGQGMGLEVFETDSFSYEIRSVPDNELVVGPVEVTLEIRPTLYVDDGAFEGHVLGDDANPGTREAPLRTVTRALELASRGSVIHVNNWFELDEHGGERFPLIVPDNVVLRSSGAVLMGHGEYFSQSLQSSLDASIVLEGRGALVQGFSLGETWSDEIADAAGIFMEGFDQVITGCDISRVQIGIMCRSVGNASINFTRIREVGIGIDVAQSLGRSALRESEITECIEIGVFLERPNDLDLGTEASPGQNLIHSNGLGVAWPLGVVGDVQDAYGNTWNEFPLSTLRLDGNEPEQSYDAIQDQELHIDSRGGSAIH